MLWGLHHMLDGALASMFRLLHAFIPMDLDPVPSRFCFPWGTPHSLMTGRSRVYLGLHIIFSFFICLFILTCSYITVQLYLTNLLRLDVDIGAPGNFGTGNKSAVHLYMTSIRLQKYQQDKGSGYVAMAVSIAESTGATSTAALGLLEKMMSFSICAINPC